MTLESQKENGEAIEAKIDPDFLFRKILAQPKFVQAYEKEILEICRENPDYVVRIGKEWSDSAFDAVADELFMLLNHDISALKHARATWKYERVTRLAHYLSRQSGNLTVIEDGRGNVSLSSEPGELSLPTE